jgi:hypothetical protein
MRGIVWGVLGVGYCVRAIGWWLLGEGYFVRGIGWGVLVGGYRVRAIGWELLGEGYWVRGIVWRVLGEMYWVRGIGWGVLGEGYWVNGIGLGVWRIWVCGVVVWLVWGLSVRWGLGLWVSAYYNDNIFLKHRKKRSSGGSIVLSAGDSHWMSTGICRSNGRYLTRAPSSGRYFLWATWNKNPSLKSHLFYIDTLA